MSRRPPDPEQLLEFARQFARELHHVTPPDADLRERIEYVVWGRKQAWSCLEDEIISERELLQLLIDHLDYECAHLSGRSWLEFPRDQRELFMERLGEILYG